MHFKVDNIEDRQIREVSVQTMRFDDPSIPICLKVKDNFQVIKQDKDDVVIRCVYHDKDIVTSREKIEYMTKRCTILDNEKERESFEKMIISHRKR